MKFVSIAIANFVAVSAQTMNIRSHRYLSYEKIAGYAPGSQVTDHCAIDLDQAAIERSLAERTSDSFARAFEIYKQGGHSKSFAQVTLASPLTSLTEKGAAITGTNADGEEVVGKAYETYDAGTSVIKVQYQTSDIQSDYVGCQVGALAEEEVNMSGCLSETGTLTIGGTQYSYSYSPTEDNMNGRTISGFSTDAEEKMRNGCKGCPYKDFMYFYDYYGTDTYADDWVTAAFNGEKTNFKNGNADFSLLTNVGKEEIISKATAYMNIFMYVFYELEDALDDCESGCINCNADPVHAWDEGVCFYTGSVEGQDATESGYLLHELADKRCQNFKTCGSAGSELSGTSAINYAMFDLFAVGNHQIQSGNCQAARDTVNLITQLMYVPMIQGTIRYAYTIAELQGAEKEKAEGAAFAAAVLPRIHAASPDAATTIYNSMKIGATGTNANDVKTAFESVYPQLGISCSQVGGLWNEATKTYYEGMEPCVDTTSQQAAATNNTLGIALGVTFGVLFILAVGCILYMRNKEQKGKPIFGMSESKPYSA